MKAKKHFDSVGFKTRLNEVKASGGMPRFFKGNFRASSKKIGRKYAKAHLIEGGEFLIVSRTIN
jgi:hypothetical protein